MLLQCLTSWNNPCCKTGVLQMEQKHSWNAPIMVKSLFFPVQFPPVAWNQGILWPGKYRILYPKFSSCSAQT